MSPRLLRLGLGLLLALGTTVLYAPTVEHDFLDYDDRQYVHGNPGVAGGLSPRSVAWAVTTSHAANWHPLTWISHQLDVSLFGLEPAGHHGMNVALHVLNVLLLFAWLCRATGATGRSAFVAAVFAVHPLQIDTVAWIAERKNLLCTTFGFAAILAWLRYCEKPGATRYATVAVLFAAGLLAKPMLVTLPLLLLLLDYWPLGRMRRTEASGAEPTPASSGLDWPALDGSLARRCAVEKLPLLAITAAVSAATLWAQRAGGAVEGLDPFPLGLRLANAVVAYGFYLGKLVWPTGLAILHPHPAESLGAGQAGATALVLLVLAIGIARAGRSRPYLWIGSLWLVGTLVPVIGLVQVGAHGVAERYAYLPMVGALIAFAWLASDIAERWRIPGAARIAAALAIVAAFAFTTRGGLPHWRSEIALFSRAVAVHEQSGVDTRHAMILYYQLGHALQQEARTAEAIARYETATLLNTDYAPAHNNLGTALERLGQRSEAAASFARALEANPDHAASLYNLGLYTLAEGEIARAQPLLARYLALGTHRGAERVALARAYLEARRPQEAERVAALAVRLSPEDASAHAVAAKTSLLLGRDDRARLHYRYALAIDPRSRVLRNNLAYLLATSEDARVRDPERAVRIMQELAAEGGLDASEADTLATAEAALRGGS